MDDLTPRDLIDFWTAAGPKAWFKRDPAFDAVMRARFEAAHLAASRGELADWGGSGDGALALVLLLDQAPRNIYRGSAHAFATDGLALAAAARAVDAGFDLTAPAALQVFFYLPFEHAEDLADQDRSVALCEAMKAETGDEGFLKWAIGHRDVIVRFGRFPHRNRALGRATTAEEQAFLDEGGFAG